MKKKRYGFLRFSIAFITSLITLIGAFFVYALNYYHAEPEALNYLKSTNEVTVKEENNYYSFTPINSAATGIILYPGAQVDERAYSELAYKLALEGYYVGVAKFPFKFAFFGMNIADEIIEDTNLQNYYLMGHSLGGAMGASYISENASKFKGLILLAAYSTSDLSDLSLNILSIYGSEDKVLNKTNYEKYKSNLGSFEEVIIDGGCHAYYADYGEQKGDGVSSITRETQINKTIDAIKNMINKK